MLATRDFSLYDWQQVAVERWVAGDARGAYRGTLEVFTGGGKTLIALSGAAAVARIDSDVKLAVVVPTQALARQWVDAIATYTNIPRDAIGLLGAGKNQSLQSHQALVAVINTAAAKLPKIVADESSSVMLVIDECHRAGADTFRRVLKTPARYTLGLSATPERDEFDEEGEPLRYDEQAVAQGLGALVYRFGLKEAREISWLPHYEIQHHGVSLTENERKQYEDLTRQVDDAKKRLEGFGQETRRARQLTTRQDEIGALARGYVAITGKRKDLLYRAKARNLVAAQIVRSAYAENADRRIILFHERVAETEDLYEQLATFIPKDRLALEHSKLPDRERQSSLARFRSGEAHVLVSVKSLVEGIDVPEADMGVSVASSASVRQRIQSLGRVLRRSFDETAAPKEAVMHVIYVAQTVDEQIYAKEDWSDITGPANNFYWRWTDGEKISEPGPPREPQLSEESTWQMFGGMLPHLPADWPGSVAGQEYSVDTLGNVRNASGVAIVNPQAAGAMVERVRGRPGGRFRVTAKYLLVLVSLHEDTTTTWHLVGQLKEAYNGVVIPATDPASNDLQRDRQYSVGEPLAHEVDALLGTFTLRQKSGGVIEKRSAGAVEWALAAADSSDQQMANARNVIEGWRALGLQGMKFYVSSDGVVVSARWTRTIFGTRARGLCMAVIGFGKS